MWQRPMIWKTSYYRTKVKAMQVSQFAEIIMASLLPEESPAGIIANHTELESVEACIALNLSLAAKNLFVVPLKDSTDLLIVHEPSFVADLELRNALIGITVNDGYKLIKKEHLL